MKEFNEVAKGTISEDDLTRAKLVIHYCYVVVRLHMHKTFRNQLKASYLMNTEAQPTLLEDIGAQVL